MVTSFNHSGVVVGDLELVLGFYRDILGLEVLREVNTMAPPTGDHTGIPDARRRLVFLRVPGDEHVLELVHYIDPRSPDGHLDRNQLAAAHVCFNVNALEQFHANLVAKNVPFVTPPIFRDTLDGERTGVCYSQDPEGNWVEFIERTGGNL